MRLHPVLYMATNPRGPQTEVLHSRFIPAVAASLPKGPPEPRVVIWSDVEAAARQPHRMRRRRQGGKFMRAAVRGVRGAEGGGEAARRRASEWRESDSERESARARERQRARERDRACVFACVCVCVTHCCW